MPFVRPNGILRTALRLIVTGVVHEDGIDPAVAVVVVRIEDVCTLLRRDEADGLHDRFGRRFTLIIHDIGLLVGPVIRIRFGHGHRAIDIEIEVRLAHRIVHIVVVDAAGTAVGAVSDLVRQVVERLPDQLV